MRVVASESLDVAVNALKPTGARWFGLPVWQALEHTSADDSALVWRLYVFVAGEREFVTEAKLGTLGAAVAALM